MTKALFTLVGIVLIFGFTPNHFRDSSEESFTVLIDAAHGGDDYGLTHQGVSEKEITLAIAQKIKLYSDGTKINVILTRSKDEFKTLVQRVEISKKTNTFLLISLHVSSSETNLSGAEIYYTNNVNYTNESNKFSSILVKTFQKNNINLEIIKKESANYFLLKNAECPSVVLDLGFINNQNDKAYIATPRFQNDIAKAIISSILSAKNS